MATSLLALLDDIATILDDVAAMTKIAAKKTAGVLGDDLALNAQQVTGVSSDRELPVVWAVAVGSLKNKAILVPGALAISTFMPWMIVPLLMLGGAYLCYEGVEKLAHKFLHSKAEDHAHEAELAAAVADPDIDLVALEKEKIKGAIRTDFILSAEIIVISLGTVATASFGLRVGVLVGISILMTVGVYGLVAGIVKLDDLGVWLTLRKAGFQQKIGKMILTIAPYLMKTLSIVGTAAMFLVGGGILTHGIPVIHHFEEQLAHSVQGIAVVGGLLAKILPMLIDAAFGILVGALVLAVITGGSKLFKGNKTAAAGH